MNSPYIGLDYFNEADAPLFFGRDAERTRLIGNLRASRLTLLYAQSGAGKSSLLRAGVAARLHEIARARRKTRTPLYVPVVFSAWHGDPRAALIDELELAMREVAPGLELPRDSLQAALVHATQEAKATPLVMFDQFEEYFLYHPEDGDDSFADDIAACVKLSELSAHFLISIREDAYSRIGDRFSTRIPHVFANYLHLDYLDEISARQAITRPLVHLNEHRNGSPALSIEDELVDEVLRQVRRPPSPDGEEDRFETPYLQLVMERLWNEDGASGSLRLATLERLGGASKIVRGHLEDAMAALPDDQRAAAASALRFLVTSGGSKIALTAAELSELAGIPEATLDEPLQWLEKRRVLRRAASRDAATRYELFHDVLGEPVIEWRKRFEQEVEADRQAAELKAEDLQRLERERARHRKQLVVISTLLLSLLVCALGALVLVVLHQRSIARSHALAAAAEGQVDANPDLSILLAREAWNTNHDAQTEEALRLTVSNFPTRARGDMRVPGNRLNAYPDHDGHFVAVTSTDSARIYDAQARRWLVEPTLKLKGRIASVAWSGDNKTVVVAGRGGAIVMRLGEAPRTLTTDDVRSADLNRTGRAVALAIGRAATVYDAPSGKVLAVERRGFAVRQVAFAPKADGVLGIATCEDGDVRLWRWRTDDVTVLVKRKETSTHPGRGSSDGACLVAFSADGQYVATAVRTQSPRMWKMPEGDFVASLGGYDDVVGLSFGPKAHTLLVKGSYSIQAFDNLDSYGQDLTVSANRPGSYAGSSSTQESATVATIGPDKRVAVGGEAGGISVGSLGRGASTVLLAGHTDRVNALAFVTGGNLMSVGGDGKVRFWDVTLPEDLLRTSQYEVGLTAAFRPDGSQFAIGGSDGTLRLIDSPGHRRHVIKPKRNATSRRSAIVDTRYLPDGRLLVVHSSYSAHREEVQILDPRTNAPAIEFKVPGSGPLDQAAVGGGMLVMIRDQGLPMAIDVHTQRRVRLKWPEDVNARSVDASQDGRALVIGGDDGRARIFTAPNKAPIAVGQQGGALKGAIFSPDATQVLTYGGDRLAHLWRIAGNREVATLRGHTGGILSAAFSHDGRLIATGGADAATRIWTLEGRKVAVDHSHGDSVVAVAFDPRNAATILTASYDGTATLIHCDTCGTMPSVERLAHTRPTRELTKRERQEFLG